MYSVSEEYLKAVEQPVRNFKITVRFRYQNAPQVVFDDDKIIGEVKIESQAVSGSSTCGIIDIGAVPSATAELTIIDDDTDLHRYAGASFTIHVFLQLENGEYEDVPMGRFFCDTSKMSRVGNQINVFGYDSMTSLNYTLPDAHRRQIQGKSACDSVWVLVAYGSCGFNQDLSEFPNSDIPLDFSSPQIETARDAIMWITQLMGCFARINRRNYLEFVPIKSTWEWLNEDHTLGTIIAVRNITENTRYKTKFSDDRIHIVGVSMPDQNNNLITRGGGGLADDSNITISLEKNPLIANSAKPLTSILDDILAQLRTAYFYAFNAEITGDPALDVGDTIRLKGGMINGTNKNNDLIGFITHNVWRYCGKHEELTTGQTPIAYGSGAEAAAISLYSDDDPADTYAAKSSGDEPYHVAPRPQSEKAINGTCDVAYALAFKPVPTAHLGFRTPNDLHMMNGDREIFNINASNYEKGFFNLDVVGSAEVIVNDNELRVLWKNGAKFEISSVGNARLINRYGKEVFSFSSVTGEGYLNGKKVLMEGDV